MDLTKDAQDNTSLPRFRLRKAREAAGYPSPAAAARAIREINVNTLTSVENGNRELSKRMASVYGKAFNVAPGWLLFGETDQLNIETLSYQSGNDPTRIHNVRLLKVLGTAEAGAFRDISLVDDVPEDDLPTTSMVRDSRFEHAKQYALRLVGDSMNLVYPDGCFVICADWADTGLALKPGMRLHVERYNGPLVETTVKEYVERDGVQLLTPRSTNPAHKEIEIHENDGTEFVVRGLIIGSFVPETLF